MKMLVMLLFSQIALASCPEDTARLHFISSCTGAMFAKVIKHDIDGTYEGVQAQCKCAANRFDVEKIADDSCEYSNGLVYAVMDKDSVKLRCRQ